MLFTFIFSEVDYLPTRFIHILTLTHSNITAARLLDLRIEGDTITENYLSDSSLGKIAKACPNLKHFAYKISSGYYYKEELDMLTGKGIIALVSDCRRLEILKLKNAKRVGRETFEEILQMLARAKESSAVAKAVVSDNDGTFALRKIILSGYNFIVTGNPLCIQDTDTSDDSLVEGRLSRGAELMRRIMHLQNQNQNRR